MIEPEQHTVGIDTLSSFIDGTLAFNVVEIGDTLQECAELIWLHVKRFVQTQDEIGVCLLDSCESPFGM